MIIFVPVAILSFFGRSKVPVMSVTSTLSYVLFLLYFALMESSHKQATLGKLFLGIAVADAKGGKISFNKAIRSKVAHSHTHSLRCSLVCPYVVQPLEADNTRHDGRFCRAFVFMRQKKGIGPEAHSSMDGISLASLAHACAPPEDISSRERVVELDDCIFHNVK